MRNPILAALLAAACAAPAAAQAPPVKITSVKIGFPPGRFVATRETETGQAAHVAKNNTWAPVYVDLEIVKETKRKAAIVIEAKEADPLLQYTVTVPLPNLEGLPPGTQLKSVELPRLPYMRPSGHTEDVIVAVRSPDTSDPSNWRNLAEPYRVRYLYTRDVSRFVVLSLGTKLPGLDLPKEQNPNLNQNVDAGRALRDGRIETAAITEVAQLPDRWFGYEAADLVVLTTGATDDKFLDSLFADPAHRPRLDALFEWVRRGGKLVVSVGIKAPLVAQYEPLKEILPAEINRAEATVSVDELNLDWVTAALNKVTNVRVKALQARQGSKIPLANIVPKPGQAARTLVPPPATNEEGLNLRRPVVVQSAYGMGRVSLIGIDLDRSPFLDHDPQGKAEFWNLVIKECGAAKASTSAGKRGNVNYSFGGMSYSDTEDELAQSVRTHIDNFEGVPVISFGWVALFIILYTLLIGPVEYFILKKVFKRLELTWITFPIIVLTVSAIAYFTAYALKGDDLKINKMDVIDVDPASGRVYGKTWFTIFSPRIESYTVGTEPNDGWAVKDKDMTQPDPLVDWFGGTQSGRSGIFSRRYHYHCDPDTGAVADGLIGVPIQVWSTKAFQSDWSARTDRVTPPVVSNLSHPPAQRAAVAGTFTLNLPLRELKDVRLIYAGKAYKHDTPITPGTTVSVFLDTDKADTEWLKGGLWGSGYIVAPQAAPSPGGRRSSSTVVNYTHMSPLGMMFHEATNTSDEATAVLSNASLRRLDQSWRVSQEHRDEVIVIGRVDLTHGRTEDVMGEANSASPTKLWLKALPGSGAAREPIQGTIRQETYVRIFVPVKPAAKKWRREWSARSASGLRKPLAERADHP